MTWEEEIRLNSLKNLNKKFAEKKMEILYSVAEGKYLLVYMADWSVEAAVKYPYGFRHCNDFKFEEFLLEFGVCESCGLITDKIWWFDEDYEETGDKSGRSYELCKDCYDSNVHYRTYGRW